VAGCSKRDEQPVQPPATNLTAQSSSAQVQIESPKKTLSGVFDYKEEDSPQNYHRLDFRKDGTLVYKMQAIGALGTVTTTIEGDGKGTYMIQDDKVTADIMFVASVSYSPSYGTKPKILDPQTNQRIFRIDGDDLISLSIAVPGEKTNADNETRWMRKR
jgi:hypothetical protein